MSKLADLDKVAYDLHTRVLKAKALLEEANAASSGQMILASSPGIAREIVLAGRLRAELKIDALIQDAETELGLRTTSTN